jgi:hypothetical protein
MAAFYALQTALINSLPRRREPHALLDEVGRFRNMLRREWERVKIFLEHCDSYSEEYISLCGFVFDGEYPPDVWGFLDDVSSLSKGVLREIKIVKTRHESVSQEIVRRRAKLSSALAPSADRSIVSGKYILLVLVIDRG